MRHLASLFCAALLLSGTSATARELTVNKLAVVEKLPDMPMGQATDNVSLLPEDTAGQQTDSDLFGTVGGGYVHPFISISGEYTDNLYNVDLNTTSNFLTTISPGIWLSVPRRKEVPLHVAPNNTSAGGLQTGLPDYESFDRINAYVLGALDYKMYSDDSDLNDWGGIAEGLFRYNLRGGLSLGIVDRFTRGQDRFDISSSTAEQLRMYYSNVAIADADWLITEKLRAKVEYSNFYLDYDDTIDEFMNRSDNSFSVYGFFNYSLKTSLFLQYQYIDVSYDTAELKDNEQDYFYGGINWVSSEKASLHFKAGYQQRTYRDSVIDALVEASDAVKNDGFALELTFQYKVTDKTGITLGASNKIEESDSYDALNKDVITGTFRYEQEFTQRFTGILDLRYENADYGMREGSRDEDRYVARPALQYVLKDWLMAEIAYMYDTRDSSDDYFDYSSNTISFSLNSAL